MKVTVMRIMIWALGIYPNSMKMRVGELEIWKKNCDSPDLSTSEVGGNKLKRIIE